MIRAATILDSIAKEGRACLARLHPSDAAGGTAPADMKPLNDSISAPVPGVLVAIDEAAIVKLVRAADCQVVLVPRVGDYVPAGAHHPERSRQRTVRRTSLA